MTLARVSTNAENPPTAERVTFHLQRPSPPREFLDEGELDVAGAAGTARWPCLVDGLVRAVGFRWRADTAAGQDVGLTVVALRCRLARLRDRSVVISTPLYDRGPTPPGRD